MAFIDYYKILGVDRNIPQKLSVILKSELNTINTENSGVMLKPMKMLVALVDSKVDKVEEIPLADLTLAVSVMAEVALAASSKISSEAVDVAVHLDSTLVEHKANVLQDKWRLLLASTFTPLY